MAAELLTFPSFYAHAFVLGPIFPFSIEAAFIIVSRDGYLLTLSCYYVSDFNDCVILNVWYHSFTQHPKDFIRNIIESSSELRLSRAGAAVTFGQMNINYSVHSGLEVFFPIFPCPSGGIHFACVMEMENM